MDERLQRHVRLIWELCRSRLHRHRERRGYRQRGQRDRLAEGGVADKDLYFKTARGQVRLDAARAIGDVKCIGIAALRKQRVQ